MDIKSIFESKITYYIGVILICIGMLRFILGAVLFPLVSIGACYSYEDVLAGLLGLCNLLSILKLGITFALIAYGLYLVFFLLGLITLGLVLLTFHYRHTNKRFYKKIMFWIPSIYIIFNLYSLISYTIHYESDAKELEQAIEEAQQAIRDSQ